MHIAKRRQQLLLVLPILVLPFLTLGFWALGGGRGKDTAPAQQEKGLNTQLPEAAPKKDEPAGKMAFYDRAERDSLRRQDWLRTDPAYKNTISDTRYESHLNPSLFDRANNHPEAEIRQRIQSIEAELQPPSAEHGQAQPASPLNGDIQRLEQLMEILNKNARQDPQLRQIETTLDKLLDVQHPDRVATRDSAEPAPSQIRPRTDSMPAGFYGIGGEAPVQHQGTVTAVVHEDQVLVNDAVIRLRLTQDLVIDGVCIPAGTFLYGMVSLDKERLQVTVTTIRYGNYLFPVKLEGYDTDGLPGLYIPGAISRDVAKQSAGNSLGLLELNSMNPSLQAQAMGAGIQAAKEFFTRKVKRVRVLVKSGYQVLLRNKETHFSKNPSS